MIDLHCHLLPGIDDGATSLDESIAMAEMAVSDGITTIACTPHIFPGLYNNNRAGIVNAIEAQRQQLESRGIPLTLVEGADVQLAPNLREKIQAGQIPTLNGSRYLLFEPPHHVAPPRMGDVIDDLLGAQYVPIITHPERLTWIETGYDIVRRAFEKGAWIQLTAGAITGQFGSRAQYWSEKFLNDGMVHILATDAHNLRRRRPILSEARDWVARRFGEQIALDMVLTRPQGILDNLCPAAMPPLPIVRTSEQETTVPRRSFWRR